jgi:hypothetical protein
VKNIYISSPLTRTITTALLALRFVENAVIYVVPCINEIENVSSKVGIDHQNTAVPCNLLKKKIFFIKEWLGKFWITKFDDIEIRNFLKNIYRTTTNENLKLVIYNFFYKRMQGNKSLDLDLKNIQPLINNLICDDNLLSYIKRDDCDLYEKIVRTLDKLKKYKNKFDKFKKGPTVNFEIYEHYEKLKKNKQYEHVIPNLAHTNTDFFYTNVLNVILRDIRFNEDTNSYPKQLRFMNMKENYNGVKIFAFAHGSLIRNIWKTFNPDTYENKSHELENMMNTAIITDKIEICTCNHIIINHEFSINDYKPEKIRKIDDLNFESYNENICKLESVKGIINYFDELDKPEFQKYQSSDIDYYKANRDKFNNDNLPSQFAGANLNNTDPYKNKYIKYKNKYLNLKNNT